MVWDHDVAGSNPVTPTTVILNIGGTDMKTRITIEGTSKGGLTEEAYTLSNPPPRTRLLGAWLGESIIDGDFREFSIEEPIDKVRVLFSIAGLTDSGAVVVREFTLDSTTEGRDLGLSYLSVEFWMGRPLNIGWDGSTLQVEFVSGFGVTNGDIILYEAF